MGRLGRRSGLDLSLLDIADIAVIQRLAPGPVAGLFENQNRLAVMVEGVEVSGRVGGAAPRGAPGRDPRRTALDKTAGGHMPAQSCIGQIVAIGMEPRV